MLALGAAAYTLTVPGAVPRPLPYLSSTGAVPSTELGGVMHFPAKMNESGWPETEAALDRLKTTLGPNAYVRWDVLWHEANWEPDRPYGYDRVRHIVGLLKRRGLRSLMGIIPHPWPGSVWDAGQSGREWGAPKPEWFPKIAERYRETVVAYREALQENGMSEAANAVQWGNEPASGHPGGNAKLPQGTWSGHALWAELNKEPSFYGKLQVVSPALSMLDQPAGTLEMTTSVIPRGRDWTGPVDRRAMHFRFYSPASESPAAYAQAYVAELKRRSAVVLALPWPSGSPSKEASRHDGLWITEGYVASGDAPEPHATAWRQVLTQVRKGVPGVRVFFAYRFHPAGGPGGLDWRIPLAAQKPLPPP